MNSLSNRSHFQFILKHAITILFQFWSSYNANSVNQQLQLQLQFYSISHIHTQPSATQKNMSHARLQVLETFPPANARRVQKCNASARQIYFKCLNYPSNLDIKMSISILSLTGPWPPYPQLYVPDARV